MMLAGFGERLDAAVLAELPGQAVMTLPIP
jgi:hypothetical protein